MTISDGEPRTANRNRPNRLRVLELFAGIGGLATVWPEADVVAAVDISTVAKLVYGLNHDAPYLIREIESLKAEEILPWESDVWWLSPPCQPFTVRGNRQDAEDPRTRALLHLIHLIPICRPQYFMLENVSGFLNSETQKFLTQVLTAEGYEWEMLCLCPSEFGWPNRRPRVYLLALAEGASNRERFRKAASLADLRVPPMRGVQLKQFLDSQFSDNGEELFLNPEDAALRESALDRVDVDDPQAVTACFGSSYGKSVLRAGSYLREGGRLRRFTPREVARLMGFPEHFDLGQTSRRSMWKLLGNSLSLVALRRVLRRFSQLTDLPLDAGNPCFEPDCNRHEERE